MEKCKNCENLKNGSIIKLDNDGNCPFCNRNISRFYPASDLNQTNNRIREEWRDKFHNLVSGTIVNKGELLDTWSPSFTLEEMEDFIDELLKSQEHKLREELVEKIKEKLKYSICQNCGTDETIMAITDDIINLIKE